MQVMHLLVADGVIVVEDQADIFRDGGQLVDQGDQLHFRRVVLSGKQVFQRLASEIGLEGPFWDPKSDRWVSRS